MTDTQAPLRRYAAPAPTPADEDDVPETAQEAAELASNKELHALCEAWVGWQRTRRYYGQPSAPVSLLGQLLSKGTGRGAPGGGPDAECSAELVAFELAYTAQPRDALDVRVFAAHYLHRVRNIKREAERFGVSRQHWYRLVRDCRQRIYVASRGILAGNLMAGRALPGALKSVTSTGDNKPLPPM
jgi:hypothetical protein